VKHATKRKKFGPWDRLAEIISGAEQMWGRPVIRPSEVEEVWQESAFSGRESTEDSDEDAAIPQYHTFTEEIYEEHTPRTPSREWPSTPPPLNFDCKMESASSLGSHPAPDQTEVPERGIPERASAEGPEISPPTGVQDSLEVDLEVGRVNRTEATRHFEVPKRSGGNTEAKTSKATQHPEAPNRSAANTKASTSGWRPNESEAAPNVEAAPPKGPSSSRFRAAFKVLGRGLLGHPMEAIKNLIPEGFLGNARTSSPERIAQGILISHYQVKFPKHTFVWA